MKRALLLVLSMLVSQPLFAKLVMKDAFDNARAGDVLGGRKTDQGNGIWRGRLKKTLLAEGCVEVSGNNQQAYILKEGLLGVCTLSFRVNLEKTDLSGAYGGVSLAMTEGAASGLFPVSKQNMISVRWVTAGKHAGKLQLRTYNRTSGEIVTRLSQTSQPIQSEDFHLFLKYDPKSLRIEGGVSNLITGVASSVSQNISSEQVGRSQFTSYGFCVTGYKSGDVRLDDFSLDCRAGAVSAAVALQTLLHGDPLDVYICAGQSNMQGSRSEKNLLPQALQAEQSRVFLFDGTDWRRLGPPERGFGPEISFAYEIQKTTDRPFGLIKYSKGGTSLAVDWNPADPDSLYARLKEQVELARQSRQIRIKGMIWMQGERDSRDEAMAAHYRENLTAFIMIARRDFDTPRMPFVAGRVNPLYPCVDQVRLAQEMCGAVPYAFVDCDDLPKYEDNLHYTTDGQVELGRRFAEKIGSLQ